VGVDRETVIAGSDRTKVSEAVAYSLDEISVFVKVRGDAVLSE
jgi:hypothetical protein